MGKDIEVAIMLTLLWFIPSTIIVLSFIYGIPSFYSIIRDLRKQIWLKIENDLNGLNTPLIAVLVPLYKEDSVSIEKTFQSIAKQKYPRDRIKVFVIIESGDEYTYTNVLKNLSILTNAGLSVTIYVNNSGRKGKASAINSFLKNCTDHYDIVVVFDGGDVVQDDRYFFKIAKLIMSGYDVVGTKVYRLGYNVFGRLSYVDTVLWYNVGLPGIAKLTKIPLVSGEGLAISSTFLNTIGGFPEVLAEDAYLTILTLVNNKKIALLDSVIYEGAPATFSSFVKQRMRWYRGHLQCLRDAVVRYRGVDPKVKFALILIYLQPIALLAPFLSLVILVASLYVEVPQLALMLAKVEIISITLAPTYLILNGCRDWILILTPLNWILQGLIVLASLIPTKMPWLRTSMRTYLEDPTAFKLSRHS